MRQGPGYGANGQPGMGGGMGGVGGGFADPSLGQFDY